MASIKAEDKHILTSFLIDAFTPDEFLALLHARTETESLAHSLSSKLASANFFFEAVLLLSRHGALNSSLFASLRKARPLRDDAISSLETAMLDPGASLATLNAIKPLMKECRADTEVEFRVSMPFKDLTVEKLSDLLDTLRNLAHNSDIVVVHLRAGSVVVRIWCRFATFELLFRAKLSDLGIEKVDLVRTIATARARPGRRSAAQPRSEDLSKLFISCFSDGVQLKRFLNVHGYHSIIYDLPMGLTPIEHIAVLATDLIFARGIGAEVYEAMLRAFPRNRDVVPVEEGLTYSTGPSVVLQVKPVDQGVVTRILGAFTIVAAVIVMVVFAGQVAVSDPEALRIAEPDELDRLRQSSELWGAAPRYAYETTPEEKLASLSRLLEDQRGRLIAALGIVLRVRCNIDDAAFRQFVSSTKVSRSPEGNPMISLDWNYLAIARKSRKCVRDYMRELGFP